MSEPQPERVQMHRRYRYRNGYHPKKIAINGSDPAIASWPSEDEDPIGHDEMGKALRPEMDLLPLPESEQPPAPREWDTYMCPQTGILDDMNPLGDGVPIRVREIREGGQP